MCLEPSVNNNDIILYIGHSSPIILLPLLPPSCSPYCPSHCSGVKPPRFYQYKVHGSPLLDKSQVSEVPRATLVHPSNSLSPNKLLRYYRPKYYGGGLPNPIQAAPLEPGTATCWRPTACLTVQRSSHPFDRACTQQNLATLAAYCSRSATITFVQHHTNQEMHVTTTDLRDLLSHSKPIADETITLYLELLTRQYNLAYMATNIIPKLQSDGWGAIQRYFANYRNRPRRNTRPLLEGEPAIIIPCYVHNCHWVIVVRRVVRGQVLFLFADDLNNSSTEAEVRQLLSSSNTNSSFFPPQARWISCRNYTYIPHSNECGPRSLIAATIMALHQEPDELILLPTMHPNLAQIARTFVAHSLLTNHIDYQVVLPLLAPHTCVPLRSLQVRSQPFHLIPWPSEDSAAVLTTHNRLSPQSPQHVNCPLPSQLPSDSNRLNPRAQEYIPKHTTSSELSSHKIKPNKSRNQMFLASSNRGNDGEGSSTALKPTKRINHTLPGQGLLSSFFPQTIRNTHINPPQSMSGTSTPFSQVPSYEQARLPHQKDPLRPTSPSPVSGQKTLFDFHYFKPQSSITEADPDVWGHMPEQIDATKTFRILLQNPNGIRPSVTEPEFLFSLHICHEIGAGAICLAETNLNWHRSQHRASMRRCLHRHWKSSRFQISVPKEEFLSNYQPGGTATIITDQWTSRIISTGMDPYDLGRWSFVHLRGKSDKTICVITAYRVCNDKYTGPKTAYQQQKRQLSEIFRDQKTQSVNDPYKQFIVDLHRWITSLQVDGTQIILCLDNNEELIPNKGQLITLSPSSISVTHPTHDGTLETLARSTGLVDVLRHHHPSSSYPPTYNRGKKRIDLILASASLLPTITRSGILPYNSIFQGDHRPCYIDLDSSLAFGGKTSPACPPCQRGLQLHDPRRVSEYITTLNTQLETHNILQKVTELHTKTTIGWDSTDYAKYETIDQLITEAMLYAERQTSSRFTKTFEWSPTLMKAVYAERYWRLAYKQSVGRFVSENLLLRTRRLAGIPISISNLQLPHILQCLKAARETRKLLQKDHRTLRRNYLEKLSEALVLKRSPSMADPANADRREKRIAKEVKRLIRLEYKRYLYRLIDNTLADTHDNVYGLSRVDVPAPLIKDPLQHLDPKIWKGPWVSVTDPTEIAQFICLANTKQYNQASNTPFASEYLAHNIGMNLEGPAVPDILGGTFHFDPSIKLLPETKRIITTLGTPPKGGISHFPTLITLEEFQSTYSLVKERTSSSLSGRHVGHYKAATNDDILSLVHSKMMSLPYIVGFSPERWQKVVDVMLEKEPGNPKIHRLRIIALIESDYNQSQRILLARRLTHRMEDVNIVPEMQYGSRPGKLCISPVLNKQLTHDIIRQTRQTVAVIENDATGCYDRLMNPLLLLGLRWLGVPNSLARSIALSWTSTTHFIKTQFGVSSATYSNSTHTPLFGPGQGSTTGPTLWQLTFIFLEDSAIEAGIDLSELEEPLPLLTLTSVDATLQVESSGEAFVDDSNLISPSSLPTHPHQVSNVDQRLHSNSAVKNLQVLAQRWERALFSTGGAINFSKSFWFVFHWRWTSGVPQFVDPPSSLKLLLTEGNDIDQPVEVPIKSTNDTYRTLGVHISPSGSTKGSYAVLLAKAQDYQTKIMSSTLPQEAALLSYNVYLLPKLGYPLPALTFTEDQCRTLQSPTLLAVLPKVRFNRHTARSIVFGPIKYGGLNIKSLYSVQSLGQLTLYVGHSRLQDKTSKLLQVSLSYLQLAVGSSTSVFQLPPSTYVNWIDACWLVSLWIFLHKVQLHVTTSTHWMPKTLRQYDKILMDYFIALGYTASALGALNRCRIYLQIITLSDIVSADGSSIMPGVFHGIPLEDRVSTLKWPCQQRPPARDWELWSSALHSLQPRNHLIQPLGEWTTHKSHQTWYWYKAQSCDTYYRRDLEDNWSSFTAVTQPGRLTRSTSAIVIDASAGRQISYPPVGILPSSAIYNRYTLFTTVTPGPPKPSPPIPLPSANTAPNMLLNDVYFKSYFHHYTFPDDTVYQQLASEVLSGISVVYRSLYDTDRSIFGWSMFSTTSSAVLHSGIVHRANISGVSSMCRTELESLLLVLNLLRCILQCFSVNKGSIQIFCLTKKLTKLSRGLLYRSVAASLADHGDLLAELVSIQKSLRNRAVVTYKYLDLGDDKCPIVPLHQVEQLGTTIKTYAEDMATVLPHQDYVSPSNNAVTLYYKGQPLLTHIKRTITHDLHFDAIRSTICKQENWTLENFSAIDWDAHEFAFSRTWSCRRITYSKLTHKLLNTNDQNKRFYGKSDLCPCCLASSETFAHVLTCPSSDTVSFRSKQQEILWHQMTLCNTPDDLILAFKLGVSSMEQETSIPSFTSESISTAFQDQATLGWEPFLRGRISLRWRSAFATSDDSCSNSSASKRWAGQIVTLLLNYSQQLWVYRCGVVHGHTIEEHRQKHREDLQHSIQSAYEEYDHDPFCVASDWRCLFNRPVESLLRSDRDTLVCWLRSYSEARQQQTLVLSRQAPTIKQFFRPLPKASRCQATIVAPPPVKSDSISLSTAASWSDSVDSDDDSSSCSDLDYVPFPVAIPSSRREVPAFVDSLDTG